MQYSKYAGYVGTEDDLISSSGALYNGMRFGWTSEHLADFGFSLIGFIPVYGDGVSLAYMGAKMNLEMVKNNPQDAIRRFDAMNDSLN